MAFYTFNQNNSGGSFVHDASSGLSKYVIVEAPTLSRAVSIARDVGLYFDGVESGYDCGCCGDRWYEPWSDDGTEEPEVYGETLTNVWVEKEETFHMKWIDGPEAYVHYSDGSFKGFLA